MTWLSESTTRPWRARGAIPPQMPERTEPVLPDAAAMEAAKSPELRGAA